MTRRDGKPAFTELDHSFPVAERMLMATSGWVFCSMPPEKKELDRAKPTLQMAAPASVHAFVRTTRYSPVSCRTHVKDFVDAMQAEPTTSGAEIVLGGGGQWRRLQRTEPNFPTHVIQAVEEYETSFDHL